MVCGREMETANPKFGEEKWPLGLNLEQLKKIETRLHELPKLSNPELNPISAQWACFTAFIQPTRVFETK